MKAEEKTLETLVKQAIEGRRDALETLTQRVEGTVYAYINRVTLNPDLAQDLCQEVLLTMVRSVGDIRDPGRFWPWLYRTAHSKIQEHFRSVQRKRRKPDEEAYRSFLAQRADPDAQDGLHAAMHQELIHKVLSSMRLLSEQYREVLSLRCFDQMSYGDIAAVLGSSETQARVRFYRARKALRRQLTRQGVEKSMLVVCLGLFAKATTRVEAANAPVAAATLEVGVGTALLSHLASRAALAAAVVVSVALAAISALPRPDPSSLPRRSEVTSLQFTTQLQFTGPQAMNSLSKGAYEQAFYFPDGPDGPAFFRMQRWNPRQTKRLCAWLQDGNTNYYFESGARVLYLKNERVCWSSLKVRRLPTDSAELTNFLSRVERDTHEITYQRDRESGMLVQAVDDRFLDVRHFQTDYLYNTVGPEAFEPNWPADTPIEDQRDTMHRRGWTYFRVEGQIAGRRLSGCGCLPFFYEASNEHPAWLTLRIDDRLEILDCNRIALLRETGGRVLAACPGGSFFAGLGRPWMGLHVLDCIRRDAARDRIWFSANVSEDGTTGAVTLIDVVGHDQIEIVCGVNMEADVLEQIGFRFRSRSVGVLNFSYLDEVAGKDSEFPPPKFPAKRPRRLSTAPGVHWLMSLATGGPHPTAPFFAVEGRD